MLFFFNIYTQQFSYPRNNETLLFVEVRYQKLITSTTVHIINLQM
jgi:hypothetical protein